MDVNYNQQYLTFGHIDKFKGLLIILIIAGHIKGLTTLETQSVLYTFHVASFFFLPFLFNSDKFIVNNVLKILKRIYIPYTVFFFIAFVTYSFLYSQEINVFSLLDSWLIGTSFTLRENIGFSTYWFFPALSFLLFTLMIFNSLKRIGKNIFMAVMVFLHFTIGAYSLPYSDLLRHAPFSFYIAFYLFSIGILIKNILLNIEIKTSHFITIIIVFIILLTISYGGLFNLATPYFPSIVTRPFDFLIRDLIMITGFFSLLFISRYFPFLSIFGKYSLGIYTIHPFIIQALIRMNNSEHSFVLIIKLVIVSLFSLGLTALIYKLKISKLIYPR